MMQLLYRFGIMLMRLFLRVHALFNRKSALAIAGRRNLLPELKNALEGNTKSVIWFHCASLGEFEQGRSLIEHFKIKHDYFILLTFFSPSGYEIRKNYEHADYVTYMPFDTALNAENFVRLAQPKMAFFIKYEFWYFHLKALEQHNCWTYSVSTILRSNQLYFKWYGGFGRKMLHTVDHFFVQNATTEALLKAIDIHNVTVSGDTRFDRVNEIAQGAKSIAMFNTFTKNASVIIGGSTWEPDAHAINRFLQQHKTWKAIIAPHDISERSLKMHESVFSIPSERFSSIADEIKAETRVIIMDNVGMLTSLYQYGTVAFIGGAFGTGLHNTLEAACFGLPIFFGNKSYSKFQEACDLLQVGAAQAVQNGSDFQHKLEDIIASDIIESVGALGKQYVTKNIGATEKIINHINPLIEKMENES